MMIESYKRFWVNIFDFSGVANRADYWWPIIINFVLGLVLSLLFGGFSFTYNIHDISIDSGSTTIGNSGFATNFMSSHLSIILIVILTIVWIASLSVKIRRLHDTNRSGFWFFINFVPLIGGIWFIILMLLPSEQSRWN